MTTSLPTPTGICPYLDANDPRCAVMFSLSKLEEMTSVCLDGGCSGCAMFHRLQMEDQQGTLGSPNDSPPPLMGHYVLPQTGS